MLALYTYLMSYLNKDEGQSMAEYALIIALIAVVLIVSLQALAGGIDNVFKQIIAVF
jgi:Flp pilus assembly pilin Flp